METCNILNVDGEKFKITYVSPTFLKILSSGKPIKFSNSGFSGMIIDSDGLKDLSDNSVEKYDENTKRL